MPFQGDELYRTQEQIVASMIASFQSKIPDIWIAEDGTLRIIIEIEAGQMEGLYLSNQLVLEDMFIQTASFQGLQRSGEQLGVPQIAGTPSLGELVFSGSGGTYIPVGSEVAFDPGGGADVLYFLTIVDGTIPNPGIPTVITAADRAVSGTLTGTFEYLATFVTSVGETLAGAISNAIVLSSSQGSLTNIPLGGPGTISRKIYRSINGGDFKLITTIADNTTTTLFDNNSAGVQSPPLVSTAEQISLAAQSEENGVDFNAVSGAITILTNIPDGITSVTNPDPFDGGSDLESTDEYRQRLLEWIRSPETGSLQDLVNWSRTVPGVESATAYQNDNLGTPTNGHVTIRISGPGGTIPGAGTVADVLALLQTKVLASITIHVGTFTATSLNISVAITPDTGYTVASLTPSVKAALTNYINSIDVAGTFYISNALATVVALAGILDADITIPASNQTATAAHKFVAGTISVS